MASAREARAHKVAQERTLMASLPCCPKKYALVKQDKGIAFAGWYCKVLQQEGVPYRTLYTPVADRLEILVGCFEDDPTATGTVLSLDYRYLTREDLEAWAAPLRIHTGKRLCYDLPTAAAGQTPRVWLENTR